MDIFCSEYHQNSLSQKHKMKFVFIQLEGEGKTEFVEIDENSKNLYNLLFQFILRSSGLSMGPDYEISTLVEFAQTSEKMDAHMMSAEIHDCWGVESNVNPCVALQVEEFPTNDQNVYFMHFNPIPAAAEEYNSSEGLYSVFYEMNTAVVMKYVETS
jgi:hypothetical protein